MESTLTLTPAAAKRVAWIAEKQGKPALLRLSVEGGGCSGFQYKFDLDEAVAEDDVVIERAGLRVAVDAVSRPFLDGAVIDYRDELIGAHFAVDNPNATASCGCGTSFSI